MQTTTEKTTTPEEPTTSKETTVRPQTSMAQPDPTVPPDGPLTNNRYFKKVPSHSIKLTSRRIFTGSRIQCAVHCSLDNNCDVFNILSTNGNTVLCDLIQIDRDSTDTTAAIQSYMKVHI